MKNNKTFFTFIFNNDKTYENTQKIRKEFEKKEIAYQIINSGKYGLMDCENLGNVDLFTQFYFALKNFDNSYEYMGFLSSNVIYENLDEILKRTESIFNTYENIWTYSSYLTNDFCNNIFEQKELPVDKNLFFSTKFENYFFYIHKDLVCKILEFFEYILNNFDKYNINYSFINKIICYLTISNKKIILCDKLFSLNDNLILNKIDDDTSVINNETLNIFYSFFNLKVKEDISYEMIPNFIKINNELNYHIIHINDERSLAREDNHKILIGNKCNVKSINGNIEGNIEKFLDEYKINIISNSPTTGYKKFFVGEVGVFASHYLAWKYIVENNLNSMLILEDDAILEKDFLKKYNIGINNLPKNWDYISFYAHKYTVNGFFRENKNKKDYIINEYVVKNFQKVALSCYCVSNNGAKKLIKYVEQVGMNQEADLFVFGSEHIENLNAYCINPEINFPVKLINFETQIQNSDVWEGRYLDEYMPFELWNKRDLEDYEIKNITFENFYKDNTK